MSDVTNILTAIEQGDRKADGELLPLVYEELRKLAAARMANQPAGHTLQPTALVHVDKLATENKIGADLVKLRYFGGMTLAEAAQALGVSERTADNYWAYAKVWLVREMQAQGR